MRPLLSSVTLLIALLFISVGCQEKAPQEWSTSGTYAAWSDEATYVGIETCGSCHTPQHESFQRSQMGRSFKHATKSLSDANWDNVTPLRSEFDDMYYLPFAKGEDLFVKEYRLSGRDTVYSRVEKIDFIVGSGQHTNSHIYDENGFLYQIPVTWYAQDAKWGLAPKFQKSGNNYRFGRVITDECMACHNAQPTFDIGSENRFENVPSGIDCEKCHGPGSIHVAEKQAGIIVNTVSETDFSIVNPGKLTPELQLDVCKRCHMQGAAVFAEGQSPLDWRPGMPLSSHENVFWPRQPDSTTHFIMASHPDRLAMSACFQASWEPSNGLEPITCLTCHDPHVPVEETPEKLKSATCINCHEKARSNGITGVTCTEPTVVSGANTAACASCHLPKSPSTDIPNIRITDHFIRVPDKLTEEEAADQTRFIRLASLIEPKPTAKTIADGFLTYFEQFTDRPGMLDSASVYLRRAQNESNTGPANAKELTKSWIRLWHLEGNYDSIRRASSPISSVPQDGWTYYRIGEAFAAIADYGAAVVWYERAVQLLPTHLRFMDKLGVALTQAGRPEEAIDLYNRLLELNPKFETGLNNRGFARLYVNDLEGAEADFKQALALSPDLEQAMANLASLYLNTNRQEEARPIVLKLVRLYPENAEYAQVWNMLKR